MITTPAQLRAAQAAEREAENQAYRRHGLDQYRRFRTEEEMARLVATDAARIAAEQALNDARRESLAVERTLSQLSTADGSSLFFRDLAPHKVTPAGRAYIERGRAAQAAIQVTREALRKAVREHNAAVSEIDAAALARRRAEKEAA